MNLKLELDKSELGERQSEECSDTHQRGISFRLFSVLSLKSLEGVQNDPAKRLLDSLLRTCKPPVLTNGQRWCC